MTVVAGATSLAGRRRSKWLWVVLALSLTLNIFVAGGLLWSMMAERPRPIGPAERMIGAAHRLNLNPDQRAALQTFGTEARELNLQLRANNAPIMRQIWQEVAKPQPDDAAVAHLADQALENRRDYQHKMTADLMKFVATLTPDQRKEFADFVARRRGRGEARPDH